MTMSTSHEFVRAFTPGGKPVPPPGTGAPAREANGETPLAALFDVDLRGPTGRGHDADTARAAGYAAGWAEGRRAANAVAEDVRITVETAAEAAASVRSAAGQRALKAVADAATRLEQSLAPTHAEFEDDVVAAAFTLARAVLQRELSVAATPAEDAVARALSLAPSGGPVTLRLNPDDRDAVLAGQDSSVPLRIDDRSVIVIGDPSLSSGDAIAESDATRVDARLAAAVERVGLALGLGTLTASAS
jgi:flagellar assembly protein FliH